MSRIDPREAIVSLAERTFCHKVSVMKRFRPVALGLVLGVLGAYVARTGDRPGAAVLGFMLMFAAVLLLVKPARRLPIWARRTLLVAGIPAAACAAYFLHAATISAPLFAHAADVPSASDPAPAASWIAAADRARLLVRAAIVDQNLPGVSIAVGVNGTVVWAEGFGWRDVVTHAPVTPATRFNIGSASSVVSGAEMGSLGMMQTGFDSAADWSPEHVGEPEEDFPGFTAIHELILRPLGISRPPQPLPGDRATFYRPATFWRDASQDPREGRAPMFMRDLACCPGGKAFSSTASDLVRFAPANNADALHGDLAGGSVMSLIITRRGSAAAVAVVSNIAYANTAALARSVADAFAEHK